MGIPGLLKEIGKGERIALAKLAIEHLEKTNRPIRIAIDAAIWNFQTQAGQGGKNPALRTLFFRLLKLLALPIHPIFVYDGKNKPLTKRGKTVSRYGTCVPNELSKNLVARFQFPHHTAPGEAEAECAFLQNQGIVDAVMSQDVDAIMFGSAFTLRDWSKEGTKGNKTPTHVNVLDKIKIQETTGLDSAGMILVALLSGGDYHDGVPGFGPTLSCSIAKAGFGGEMVELVQQNDEEGLREWRERLQYELETNESGYFAKRHKTVHVPMEFPDRTVLNFYLNPAVSRSEDLRKLEARWIHWWDKGIDIVALRDYVGITFDWLYKGGARKFVRCLAQPLFQHRLKMRRVNKDGFSIEHVTDRRKHFTNDGIPELRLSVIPADVVGIDLDAEEENPEYAILDGEAGDEDLVCDEETVRAASEDVQADPTSPSKHRKRPPWDPHSVEKMWIPETLLKIALPVLVERWEQDQRDVRADPIKFATRKCRQPTKTAMKGGRKIDQSMRTGALEEYLPVLIAPNKPKAAHDVPVQKTDTSTSRQPLTRTRSNPLETFTSQDSSIKHYYTSSKLQVETQPTEGSEPLAGLSENVSEKPPPKTKFSRSQTLPTVIALESDSEDDVVLPMTVTQRKRRTPKPDDDELVLVRSSKAPPAISLFFGDNVRKSKLPKPAVTELPAFETSVVHQKLMTSIAEKKTTPMARESLPGTWKEVPMTPSQDSRFSFIDLTNT